MSPAILSTDPFAPRPHGSVGGELADGRPLAAGTPARELVVCAGAARWRVRLLATCAGTLRARYLRVGSQEAAVAASNTAYPTGHPADVAVVANTEAILTVPEHYGEGIVELAFTPTVAGAVVHCDYSQA